jgi:hypothetical protein
MVVGVVFVDPGKSLRTPTAIRKYTFPALTRVSPIGGLPRVAAEPLIAYRKQLISLLSSSIIT